MMRAVLGFLVDLVLRTFNDVVLSVARVEKRTEFLYRDAFDATLRDPLFKATQAVLTATRRDEHLGLVEERQLPDEERLTREIIDELSGFTRENWLPGSAQRFGNTKTYGVLRGELTVLADLPSNLRRGIFATPTTYRAYVRFSSPGPYAPPDMDDIGQCSVGIKLMGVPGPKLLDDEAWTQDLILVSPRTFVTPNVRENRKLQRHIRAGRSAMYFLNPLDSHYLAFILQALYTRAQSNPLECRYWSTVPFLLGDDQAVQYSLRPCSSLRTRIPARPSPNYLREAMVATLERGDWVFDFMVQPQTDSFRMPIEDATVEWPEQLSRYVTVAKLRLPAQRFDSDAQLAFADNLSFNPWHSVAEHRPLGNQNRARRTMYWELARLRQAMNLTHHVEPTGDEVFAPDDR